MVCFVCCFCLSGGLFLLCFMFLFCLSGVCFVLSGVFCMVFLVWCVCCSCFTHVVFVCFVVRCFLSVFLSGVFLRADIHPYTCGSWLKGEKERVRSHMVAELVADMLLAL